MVPRKSVDWRKTLEKCKCVLYLLIALIYAMSLTLRPLCRLTLMQPRPPFFHRPVFLQLCLETNSEVFDLAEQCLLFLV